MTHAILILEVAQKVAATVDFWLAAASSVLRMASVTATPAKPGSSGVSCSIRRSLGGDYLVAGTGQFSRECKLLCSDQGIIAALWSLITVFLLVLFLAFDIFVTYYLHEIVHSWLCLGWFLVS